MVRAVPDVPAPARAAPRRPCSSCSSATTATPFPARRPDGRHRRLPRGAARGRGDDPRPRDRRPPHDRPVDDPDGRVHGLGRDDRPQPPARHGPGHRSSAARCPSATSPTCSVTSPRCPRSCGSPASSTPSCGGACRPRSTGPRFWWEAPDGSRVRAEYLYGSYSNGRDLPRRTPQVSWPAPTGTRTSSGVPAPRRRAAAHERHRPPDAPAVARTRRRRGQRGPGRVPVRRHVARRVPARTTRRRPEGLAGRAALRRARQRAHGRRVQPGRHPPGLRGGRTRARATRRAAERWMLALRPLSGAPARSRVAQPRPQQRA